MATTRVGMTGKAKRIDREQLIGFGHAASNRLGQRLLIRIVGQKLELSGMGQELTLYEHGRHIRQTQNGEIRLFDAPVLVIRKGLKHLIKNSAREALPLSRSREMKDFHALSGDVRGGIGVNTDEQLGAMHVRESRSSAKAEGAIRSAHHQNLMSAPDELRLQFEGKLEVEILFLERER